MKFLCWIILINTQLAAREKGGSVDSRDTEEGHRVLGQQTVPFWPFPNRQQQWKSPQQWQKSQYHELNLTPSQCCFLPFHYKSQEDRVWKKDFGMRMRICRIVWRILTVDKAGWGQERSSGTCSALAASPHCPRLLQRDHSDRGMCWTGNSGNSDRSSPTRGVGGCGFVIMQPRLNFFLQQNIKTGLQKGEQKAGFGPRDGCKAPAWPWTRPGMGQPVPELPGNNSFCASDLNQLKAVPPCPATVCPTECNPGTMPWCSCTAPERQGWHSPGQAGDGMGMGMRMRRSSGTEALLHSQACFIYPFLF